MNHNPQLRKAAIGFLLVMTILMLDSCKTKKFIYLEDMPVDTALTIPPKYQTRIKPGDRLSIHVSCSKQELALPFNNVSYHVTNEGKTTASDPYAPDGYLVDEKGYINFPVLGRVYVGDLTMPMANEHIKGLILEGNHMPDAVVETRITNFTIYALGALTPAKLLVPEGQINILQAVAQLGDLQGRAQCQKVRVIREEDGQRIEYDLDMTNTGIFNSPAFYLHQNDIIYAEPKKKKSDGTNQAAIWISILATLSSIAYSITYMTK